MESPGQSAFQEFLERAVHDLRGPMGQVHALTTLLGRQHGGALGDDGRKLCGHIETAAKRAIEVIEALQTYAEILSAPVPEDQDANAIVDWVFSILQTKMENAAATADRENLPPIRGDREKLVYLFRELVGNAIKFRGERPPRIDISAVPEGAMALFSVADNGIGVPADKAAAIFEPLKRLHGREHPGTGIGLAICRGIVEMHGGRIWVEPQAGGGAAFRFTLPTAV